MVTVLGRQPVAKVLLRSSNLAVSKIWTGNLVLSTWIFLICIRLTNCKQVAASSSQLTVLVDCNPLFQHHHRTTMQQVRPCCSALPMCPVCQIHNATVALVERLPHARSFVSSTIMV